MFTEPTITLLASLYAELKDYRAKREKAAALLAEDDCFYRQQVLKNWDHAIGVKQAQIAQEEQKAAMT